jgi:hypothetical protein
MMYLSLKEEVKRCFFCGEILSSVHLLSVCNNTSSLFSDEGVQAFVFEASCILTDSIRVPL